MYENIMWNILFIQNKSFFSQLTLFVTQTFFDNPVKLA